MFGFNDNQKQITESLKPINERLNTHSEILEDIIKYKAECIEHRRREGDKMRIMMEAQEKICETLKRNEEYHERNAENLQVLADLVTTSKTGKKSIPWVFAIVGALTVTIACVVITINYIKSTIATLLS